MSKHKLNIHYQGSPQGSRTQQHAYYLRYAISNTLSLTSARNNHKQKFQ